MMANISNYTNVQKYIFINELILGIVFCILILGTVIGNGLVILSVVLAKRLQTPNNILIVNLAISDMLVALLVLPLATIYQLKGYWMFNEIVCDFFIVCDVLLCTASILNLCAISIDRYLVITKPFQYITKRNNKLMVTMVGISWLASALISIPPLFGWKQKFELGQCIYSDSLGYQIYATFGAFYIPSIIMIVLYGRIYQIAKHSAAMDSHLKSIRGSICKDPMTIHSCNSSYKSSQSDIQSQTSFSGHISSARHNINSNIYRSCTTTDLRHSCQLTLPDKRLVRNSFPGITDCQNKSNRNSRSNSKHSTTIRVLLSASRDTLTKRWKEIIHSSKRSSQSEGKAIFTLGVIMGCFCICWMPFFIIQILTPIFKIIHGHNPSAKLFTIPQSVSELFLWLGYFNSFLNPIIYVKFNKEFRTPFKEILFCRCRKLNARIRSESYMRQIGEFRKISKLSTTIASGEERKQSWRYNSVNYTEKK
uniref:Serotonin receptor 7 n=1 Tax=Dugesia japonica TaxID=6161 RepID=C9K4W1_DUGJA|nr:serotonin receptor 7 [Dugesia japonica]